ncbi:hypothetical protein HK102_008360 [Quaeritorhiza haematococci]|nr:hypothetical protein HK102_008360 [Quaeritorhiza haematococci]
MSTSTPASKSPVSSLLSDNRSSDKVGPIRAKYKRNTASDKRYDAKREKRHPLNLPIEQKAFFYKSVFPDCIEDGLQKLAFCTQRRQNSTTHTTTEVIPKFTEHALEQARATVEKYGPKDNWRIWLSKDLWKRYSECKESSTPPRTKHVEFVQMLLDLGKRVGAGGWDPVLNGYVRILQRGEDLTNSWSGSGNTPPTPPATPGTPQETTEEHPVASVVPTLHKLTNMVIDNVTGTVASGSFVAEASSHPGVWTIETASQHTFAAPTTPDTFLEALIVDTKHVDTQTTHTSTIANPLSTSPASTAWSFIPPSLSSFSNHAALSSLSEDLVLQCTPSTMLPSKGPTNILGDVMGAEMPYVESPMSELDGILSSSNAVTNTYRSNTSINGGLEMDLLPNEVHLTSSTSASMITQSAWPAGAHNTNPFPTLNISAMDIATLIDGFETTPMPILTSETDLNAIPIITGGHINTLVDSTRFIVSLDSEQMIRSMLLYARLWICLKKVVVFAQRVKRGERSAIRLEFRSKERDAAGSSNNKRRMTIEFRERPMIGFGQDGLNAGGSWQAGGAEQGQDTLPMITTPAAAAIGSFLETAQQCFEPASDPMNTFFVGGTGCQVSEGLEAAPLSSFFVNGTEAIAPQSFASIPMDTLLDSGIANGAQASFPMDTFSLQ